MSFPRVLLVTTFWLAGIGVLAAGKPRIATVDASEVFMNYHRTKTEKAKLADAQRALEFDPRTAVIAQIKNELRTLQAEISNEDNSEELREEYYRKYLLEKLPELKSLQRDADQIRQEKQKKINEQLVSTSKILLIEIQSTIQRIAANEGYDMVLDIGGETSSQVPTLLYIRKSTDITAQVLEALNRTKPADLPPGVTPAPPLPTPPPPPAPEPPPIVTPGISGPIAPRAIPAEDSE